ncbi:MAG: acyl-CoA thioesterase [Candidatus Sericytochromatia bacterium]|nr:acyl-CoA thioesterase [Candidatus Tanganyikabacteria bacterium]
MPDPAIRVILLPKDTNEHGFIFGGVIMAHIDMAGAVTARRDTTAQRVVTVAMREITFEQPVYVGDVVSFYTRITKLGRTSITIEIRVEAKRRSDPSQVVLVTTAEAVFVAIDENGRPTPVSLVNPE